METSESASSSNPVLDRVGEVVLTLDHDGLSWKPVESPAQDLLSSSCLGFKNTSKIESEIKFSDVYAVESINWGLINECIPKRGLLSGSHSEMHRFVVHGFRRSIAHQSLWIPVAYTFGHLDLQMCQMWVEQISTRLSKESGRPKNLLVFVHPLSGRGNGCRTWDTVQPIFSRANVKTKVIVTERANHAFELTTSMTDKDLSSFDGILAVGGDGFFNEILNRLLLSRHQAPFPPSPEEVKYSGGSSGHSQQSATENGFRDNGLSVDLRVKISDGLKKNEDEPLLCSSESTMPSGSNFREQALPHVTDHYSALSFPNSRFRLGLIPAGSTDSIVISTTGARDPVTSALHIVLGKRVYLDIAQVVRWRACNSSSYEPFVRYAASFAGYGFYGDVIKESEKYRWMGPKRYDYAGTKVFLRHRSYEADVAFLEVENSRTLAGRRNTSSGNPQSSGGNPQKQLCQMNCTVCNPVQVSDTGDHALSTVLPKNSRWLQRKGRFHCVGTAIISCRNERAPDGLVADAHLADGFMHLLLIKECPRPFYLWHLMKLTRRDSNPLEFKFVEHHQTPAFTFTTTSDESVWNLDGELFQACQLSAQVFRGLISLFAAGPQV